MRLLIRYNNSILHPNLHYCFQVIAEYWSNFCFCHGIPLFNTFVRGPLPKLKTMKLGLKTLETLLYHRCKMYFDTLNRVGVAYKCDRQTDGRTDRTAFSNSAA